MVLRKLKEKKANRCSKHGLEYTRSVPLKVGVSIRMCELCYRRFRDGQDSV